MMNVDFSSTNKVFFTKKTSLINENERETPRLLPLTMGGFLSSGSVSLLLFFYIFFILFYLPCGRRHPTAMASEVSADLTRARF
jgi:hypothetical protein